MNIKTKIVTPQQYRELLIKYLPKRLVGDYFIPVTVKGYFDFETNTEYLIMIDTGKIIEPLDYYLKYH